jgi:hypothetical protein
MARGLGRGLTRSSDWSAVRLNASMTVDTVGGGKGPGDSNGVCRYTLLSSVARADLLGAEARRERGAREGVMIGLEGIGSAGRGGMGEGTGRGDP